MTAPVLIVEDDPDMAENLQEILEGDGTPSRIAHSVGEALAELGREPFAGVITDFRLPDRSGVELLRELRRRGNPVPVIVISGYIDFRATEAAEAAGALDVLAKPVDLSRLLEDVSEFSRASNRVLVVDDNVELAENVADALRQYDLEPVVATSAHAALAQRNLPRLAVLDIKLPDSSGFEVARRLWARDPTIRVLFLSGYSDQFSAALEALSRELPGLLLDEPCVEKPCDVGHLAERLRAAAGGE